MKHLSILLCCIVLISSLTAKVTVSSLDELMDLAKQDDQNITMKPGVYRLKDYLTSEMLAEVGVDYDHSQKKRLSVGVVEFAGSGNAYHFDGVVFEVDTSLYDHLPEFGYLRFFFVSGNDNQFHDLTIRYVGPQKGTNGNVISLWGDGNTLDSVHVFVHGSSPYGYGDLLGKGRDRLVKLQKQSAIMVGGDNSILKRCKVISRAFGHCFYIQGAHNTLVEDCYAEGITRSTSEMLRDTSGPAKDVDFKSVYENRDGRFMINPGYRKSLTEDGFRTYGSGGPREQKTGKTTLINCTAINTRAGFEILGPVNSEEKTELIGCTSLGAERAFLLINGNIVTRRCRGDIKHGPLLYLWRGANADIELEVVGEGSDYNVHALATICGTDHRVKLTRWAGEGDLPQLPIMLGYGMPAHAEMSTPILAEKAAGITLINETGCQVIESDLVDGCVIE